LAAPPTRWGWTLTVRSAILTSGVGRGVTHFSQNSNWSTRAEAGRAVLVAVHPPTAEPEQALPGISTHSPTSFLASPERTSLSSSMISWAVVERTDYSAQSRLCC
jgi:hypothetical protein